MSWVQGLALGLQASVPSHLLIKVYVFTKLVQQQEKETKSQLSISLIQVDIFHSAFHTSTGHSHKLLKIMT